MRPVPEAITSRETCTIQLNATDVGLADAAFDTTAVSYGDGDAFTWQAGGGELYYKITRLARGFCKDEGIPLSSWLIEMLDSQENLTESYIFDGPSHEIKDHDGSPVRFELVNKTVNMVLDLFAEDAVLREQTPFRILPGDIVIVNPWYEHPEQTF